MKNLSNFEAFKLDKFQMNALTGGKVTCACGMGSDITTFEADSVEEGLDRIDRECPYGMGGCFD